MSSLEAEKAHGDTLNGVVEVEERHRVMVHDFTKITRDLQSRLDEKEAKAADIYETFRAFKAQIALQVCGDDIGGVVAEVVEGSPSSSMCNSEHNDLEVPLTLG